MEVMAFGRELGRSIVETASSGVSTSLYLLQAVEATVSNLAVLEDQAKVTQRHIAFFADAIRRRETSDEIDPNGALGLAIEKAVSACDHITTKLAFRRVAAERADELVGDHKSDVCEADDRVTEAFECVRESFVDVAREIAEHDKEFNVGIGPFDTVDELIAALQA